MYMKVVDLDKIDIANVPGEKEQQELTDIVTEDREVGSKWVKHKSLIWNCIHCQVTDQIHHVTLNATVKSERNLMSDGAEKILVTHINAEQVLLKDKIGDTFR